MPAPSKIDLLDEETRRALDAKIIDNGFGGYVALSEWLAEHGYSIGKSAVGAYGQKLERRLGAIKASTEAARLIAAAAPDEADERSNAIISLVQTEIFESLLALQDAADETDPAKRVEILGKAALNIATLTRAPLIPRDAGAAEKGRQRRRHAGRRREPAQDLSARQQPLIHD